MHRYAGNHNLTAYSVFGTIFRTRTAVASKSRGIIAHTVQTPIISATKRCPPRPRRNSVCEHPLLGRAGCGQQRRVGALPSCLFKPQAGSGGEWDFGCVCLSVPPKQRQRGRGGEGPNLLLSGAWLPAGLGKQDTSSLTSHAAVPCPAAPVAPGAFGTMGFPPRDWGNGMVSSHLLWGGGWDGATDRRGVHTPWGRGEQDRKLVDSKKIGNRENYLLKPNSIMS